MQLVRQNEESVRKLVRRRRGVRLLGGLLAASALATGCAAGGDAEQVRPAPGQQARKGLQAAPARALDSYATKLRTQRAALVAASKRWGLADVPLTAPRPPARKPVIEARAGFEVDGQKELGLPPVFTTVPTKDKVVFLTIDDGAEKDPRFLKMMSELRIPYTAFLTDAEVRPEYGYFKEMQARGVTLNNHTLHHPFLPGLSYVRQKREICGMQDVIEKKYGKRPTLFRPPFGDYNQDTLRAAKACGIEYAPIWNAEAFVDRMDYREWDRGIHPGDILLTHFRGRKDWNGAMPDMIRNLMKYLTDRGYSVARLEDYL
ncbi:polysaccharide deacetylase family protein [Streptomyces endophyticus]|uniref:Polysaccharide deacetylase family protein n=1 Tax=Streptomyces endophyticus TaxID=714166 RepID=A0ABU6FC69_9ACTN|nr:polysaccharide deacetylase family protein [Streptomyces endophyticus]MEB8341538.1 polysaccharide deacetylase family protein [Streptomyces endophyticus]